jgi:uracil phosphoribosyltransferase
MAYILEDAQNPFLGEIFRELRSPALQCDRHRFRANLRLLGTLLAYHMAGAMPSKDEQVPTPLGVRTTRVFAEPPILCAVLRAALPFWEGMLEVFRDADSMIVGAARREVAQRDRSLHMTVDLSYRSVPRSQDKDWIMVDPMLATGSTILGIHAQLREEGIVPRRLLVAAAIAYRGAIERLEREIPGVEVWVAAADDELNERGYIVPGLGDAGDLCYGEKR